ncbi:MAG: hypothetical protein Q7U10_08820 [Thermodesulfovibrionia bacterium]|nr:hypothetical protein [Thermodesulfovibrionia bacterium]
MAEVKISITAEDGTKQVFSAVREGAKTAFDSVENSAVTSTGKMSSAFDSLKSHWLEVTAGIYAAWETVSKAIELIKLGAGAMQSEESFKNVTKAYGEDADALLAKMEEVSIGAIDSSDLMQRVVKGMQQGLSSDQIVKLLEVSRSAARVAGTDIASAFDGITNAVANQTMRGLKLYGIMVDQNKAFEDYAVVLHKSKDALTEQEQSQALANAAIAEGGRQAKNMGDMTINASEQIQIAEAKIHELKETIGTELIEALGKAIEHTDSLTAALTVGAIVAAVPMLGKIVTALKAVEIGALSASLAARGIGAGIAAGVGYEVGKWLDADLYKRLGIDLSGMNRPTQELTDATEGLAWAQEELAKRQKKVSAGFSENKDAIKAVKDAAEKYADVVKDVNADLLKFAGDDFKKNLKDQEKSTGGMAQALQGYLNVTDAVYNKRLQMLFVLGQETDVELQGTAVQKAQAEARLGAWSQYYETLKGLHNAAIEAQKTKTKELLDLETRIKDQRQGYADLTLSLNQKLMTETQKYYSTQEDLELKYKSALTLTGQAKIDALTKYQTAMAATANAVTQDGQERISLEEAVATALEKNATAQAEILMAQDALKLAKQAEIDQIGVWKTSLETAMAKATEMMELYTTQITDLGTIIDGLQMNKTLTVDTAGAVMQVNSLKGAIASIPDITYKQIIITTAGGASSGDGFQSDSSMSGFHPQPLATGTPYVKKEGLFYLHVGEAVTPASMNNNNSRKTTINFSGMNININGANKDGKQLAREIDEEMADMVKNERSRLAKALK